MSRMPPTGSLPHHRRRNPFDSDAPESVPPRYGRSVDGARGRDGAPARDARPDQDTDFRPLNVDVSGARGPVRSRSRTNGVQSESEAPRGVAPSPEPSPDSVYTTNSQTDGGAGTDDGVLHDEFSDRRPPSDLENGATEDSLVLSRADWTASPASYAERTGGRSRYDDAPTPGVHLARRAYGVDGGPSADDAGGPDATFPQRDDISEILDGYGSGDPGEEVDYFSLQRDPGGLHAPTTSLPKSTPLEDFSLVSLPGHGQGARVRGARVPLDKKDPGCDASSGAESPSANASATTLVAPPPAHTESKERGGGVSGLYPEILPKENAHVDQGRPPGSRYRDAFREKVRALRAAQPPKTLCARFSPRSLERRRFVMKLAKVLLALGAPSHRIESQLLLASQVLKINARFVHFPNMIMVTFQASADSGATNEIYFIRASGRIALTPLHEVHRVYRDVLHDRINTKEGMRRLKVIMDEKPMYSTALRCMLAFICASIICVLAFGGSVLDMCLAGLAASALQLLGLRAAAKSSVYANIYEISVSIIVSFLARGFGTIPNQLFCFTAISSGGVVHVLPGFTVLVSALELTAQNIVCGSVRMVYAIIYTLFLGFGLTIGSELFLVIVPVARKMQDITTLLESHQYHGYLLANNASLPIDLTGGSWSFIDVSQAQSRVIKGCYRDPTWPWWRQPVPWWTAFFLVPLYSFCSSLTNLQKIKSVQLLAMIAFSCAAYAANRGANLVFSDRPEMVSAVGSLVVGVCGNVWARLGGGTAFTVMITGVLFLVPSALGNDGGLVGNYNTSSQEYSNSFDLGVRMIEVGIGVTLGLFLAQMIIYSWGARKTVGHFGF